jgi:hypothetical protein
MAAPSVTVDDVKRDVTPQDYETLTLGDDAAAERAIEKATVWAKGKILSTGSPFDDAQEVVKTIIVTRALYELYFYVGYPEKAKMKEEDAADLIESYFGRISLKNEAAGAQGAGPSGGAVVNRRLPEYGGRDYYGR